MNEMWKAYEQPRMPQKVLHTEVWDGYPEGKTHSQNKNFAVGTFCIDTTKAKYQSYIESLYSGRSNLNIIVIMVSCMFLLDITDTHDKRKYVFLLLFLDDLWI